MECEICGRYIEKGKRIRVENSIVTTCEECSGYGEIVEEVQIKLKKDVIQKEPAKVVDIDLETDTKEGELIDEYHSVIRESREKLGLKQEELAKAINEPISLIQRIESGKIKPSIDIAKKIQKRLKVGLFEWSKENSGLIQEKTNLGELTLGDLVVVKKRKK